MTQWGWHNNSDLNKLISVDEESEQQVTKEKNSWRARRASLEPALKCGACGFRIFVIDYCSKTFAESSMATKEVVSFVRENLQDLSCSQCGERKVQLVWVGKPR